MMNPERWQQASRILETALERNSDQRAAYLDEVCANDDELRGEVESLLAASAQAGSLLDSPAMAMAAPLFVNDSDKTVLGQCIGRYKIITALGTGGMGEVYLAHDTRLGRKIALKLLPKHFTTDKDRLRRFEQEAHAASTLSHPNICMIHEVGETDDAQHFIAMEYVDGATLRQHMTEARMKLSEVLDVAVQVASGLAASHEVGVVHRDIKPENIMLRHDGYVKVLDFGLAKLTEQQEPATQTAAAKNVDISSGLVMGTVKYMSPEQARGRQVDPRSDIFSFGVVLYEMIAGRPPFEGKTSDELISTILKKEPSPLTEVPEETQRLISRALRKKKEDRYQTIEDLLADLKSLKDQTVTNVGAQHQRGRWTGSAFSTREVAAISTATTIEYVISEIKRHKTRTALGFVTLVILLAGVGYLGYRYFFSRRAISIAVMPFKNESGDPRLEYLSD